MTIPRFSIRKKIMEFRNSRPENIRPKMNVSDRAKQFAPFESLGSMASLLRHIEESRDIGDPERIKIYEDLDLSADAIDEGFEHYE